MAMEEPQRRLELGVDGSDPRMADRPQNIVRGAVLLLTRSRLGELAVLFRVERLG